MKQLFLLTGLPRSGNTLLSSLLNQNPDISCTGYSMLSELFLNINGATFHHRYANFSEPKVIDHALKNLILHSYDDCIQKNIINRGDWIHPYCFHRLINVYNDLGLQLKIIVCVRDVLDIIKSYINLCNRYPSFDINRQFNELDATRIYTTPMETKCDLIMQKGDYVDRMLCHIKWIIDNGFLQYCHFVEYDDLVNNTQKTVSNIYEFLNIEKFEHRFVDLSQINVNGNTYNDNVYQAPLHHLRTNNIEKQNNNIVLPQKIIEKYSNLEFWREKTE